jgi:hypothetical protein
MGRLDKYKQIRNIKQKYLFSAFLFLLLLVTGICIVDNSTNSLMGEGSSISIFAVKNHSSYMEIIFMNQKLYVNTQYINRDMNRLKEKVSELFSGRD